MPPPKDDPEKVPVRTPNVPGYTGRVDKGKYKAMKVALLKIIPRDPPGLTQGEMISAAAKAAPKGMFPGSKANWWTKCVQLDLEAQGILARDGGKPLRWRRVR